MMSGLILLKLGFLHFLADFGLQTHEQATEKHKLGKFLLFHTLIYSLCFIPFLIVDLGLLSSLIFFGITFIAHTITDAITSNISKIYFDKKDFHNGFVVIGADQLLHYIQLYLTYELLI